MTGVIRLPTPHNGQRAILADTSRFKWVSAGRRWRKTTMAMQAAVLAALAGKKIFWGAPTFDQCRVGWTEFYTAVGGVADFNQSRMEIQFPGGGSVIFRSLDNPENARGHTSHGVILDEAAYIPERAYYDVLRPVISDTQGWVLAIFTPNGRNWVWRECMRAQTVDDSNYWQVPTLGVEIVDRAVIRKSHALENPDFPFSEAIALYESLPESTFRAEFLAEFLENEGAVFRKIDNICTANERPAIGGHTYIYGVDWAQSKDFTCIIVLDPRDNTVVYMDRFNGIDWALQRGRLTAITAKYPPRAIWAEANSIGGPNIEALQREGLPVRAFMTTAQSKPPLIESLVLAFERGEITALNNPILKGELMAYERKVSPTTGRSQYSAPEGMHDDTVIALALAWHGVSRGGATLTYDKLPSLMEI